MGKRDKFFIVLFIILIFAFWLALVDKEVKHEQMILEYEYQMTQEYLKEYDENLFTPVECDLLKPRPWNEGKLYARVTAYAPLDNKSRICNDGNPRITSTGVPPSRKIVAVDPSHIPYGTKLYIPDYGIAYAGDTGGALRDYEGVAIDVYFTSHDEAVKWGVRYLEVEIIEEVKIIE